MPYITSAKLAAYIQHDLLVQGLDDANEGVIDEDQFALIYEAVENEVHGYLEGRYTVPFTNPIPKTILDACMVLCSEALWLRRGFASDQNPFSKRAQIIRDRLELIQNGKINVSVSHAPGQTPGVLISEESLIAGSGRLTL